MIITDRLPAVEPVRPFRTQSCPEDDERTPVSDYPTASEPPVKTTLFKAEVGHNPGDDEFGRNAQW
jgi:hypothetical protein